MWAAKFSLASLPLLPSWSIAVKMPCRQIFLFFVVPTKKSTERSKQATTPTTTAPTNTRWDSLRWYLSLHLYILYDKLYLSELSRGSQSTPGSARKVMMGLERGLNKVRCVLTPKRRTKTEGNNPDQPNMLSGKVRVCFTPSTAAHTMNNFFLFFTQYRENSRLLI